jgi:hypothetical protein
MARRSPKPLTPAGRGRRVARRVLDAIPGRMARGLGPVDVPVLAAWVEVEILEDREERSMPLLDTSVVRGHFASPRVKALADELDAARALLAEAEGVLRADLATHDGTPYLHEREARSKRVLVARLAEALGGKGG